MSTPMLAIKALGLDIDNFQIGQTTDDTKVVIGDWNNKDYERLEDIIRRMKYDCRFEDELVLCVNCYKYCDLQPGYYGDLRTAQIVQDEAMCPDCVHDFKDDYLADKINNPRHANTILSPLELEDLNFKLIDDNFENGFHPGQTDNPKEIYAKLRSNKNQYDELLFSIDGAGQFDIKFSVWGRFHE